MPEGSYSAKLFKNRTLLLRKLMEEAFEVTLAKGREESIREIADLIYFSSVLAVDEGINWKDIEAELAGRHQIVGFRNKNSGIRKREGKDLEQ